MYKKIFPVLFLSAFFLFAALDSKAGMGPPPGPPTGNPPCWPPPCTIPLDGGLSILLAAGIGIAGKKFYEARKKSV